MTQPNENKTVTIDARHTFTDAEMSALGIHASRSHREHQRTEEEMKSAAKDWKAKLDRIALERDGVLRKLGDGFEMRPVQATVHFNDPSPGRKTFYFVMGGENASREEAMDATDFQRDLPLEPAPAAQVCAHGIDVLAPCKECDEIYELENQKSEPEPVNPERFPETGDSAAEVREAAAIIEHAAQPIGTPVGAALDKAAVQTKAAQFNLDLNKDDYTVVSLMKAVRIANKAAGWGPAEISALADILKKCNGVPAMIETLRPFVIAEQEPETHIILTTKEGDARVPLLDVDLPDGFPLEKVIHLFVVAATKADWSKEAILTASEEAERQARVIGDEPEATETATKYLRSFCVSK